MDGTAIYMSIGVLFLAHALNVHLTVTEQFTTLLVMLFTSKGAAGVTGAASSRWQPHCRRSTLCRWVVSRFSSASIALWQRSGLPPT
jgi:hypothetical protein